MTSKGLPFFLLLFSSTISFSQSTPPGSEIIKRMHTQWKGKWGKNMRFDQSVYHYENDSVIKEEVWQEILSSPKNLQIRFNGFESGNGILFKNDSVFHFAEGNLVKEEARVHHLLLLGFDVYFLSPEETEKKLTELGFDLKKSYTRKSKRGNVIVVGTDNPGDLTSSQFWINARKLYLEKALLNRNGNISEVEMKNYQVIATFPVATEIDFKQNGNLFMREKYYNVSFPKEVDSKIFDPGNFQDVRW